MARPRNDEKDPLSRLLRSLRGGDGEHREHLLAVTREAVREADSLGFGTFERVAAAMVVRLYDRSLASQDAVTVSRCLGETVRSLRALNLLQAVGQLRSGRTEGSRFRGRSPRDHFIPPASPARPAAVEESDDQDEGTESENDDETAA